MEPTRQQKQAARLQQYARTLWQMRSDLDREVQEYTLNQYAANPAGFDGGATGVDATAIAGFIDLITQLDTVFSTTGNPEKCTNML